MLKLDRVAGITEGSDEEMSSHDLSDEEEAKEHLLMTYAEKDRKRALDS